MRIAVIDCGTNTFNLLIVEASETQKIRIFNTRRSVKLGEGSINNGFIGTLAFERAMNAFAEFNREIKVQNVDHILAFATAAIRDAKNGQEFVGEIFRSTGIRIEVIDGNREASLIYLGVREAVEMYSKPSLIMDIGGGSTEFIIANKEMLFWKYSFNIGAARLLQRFVPSDPITSAEMSAINKFLEEEMKGLDEAVKEFKPVELLGSSGAFDSIVEMIHGEMNGEPLTASKTEYRVDLSLNELISEKVIQSTLAERKKLRGLVAMRQDMIVISCLMINFVLKRYGLKHMRVSTYSLKEGALSEFLNARP